MRSEFRTLRLKQLDRDLNRFREARSTARPAKGWLRAIREALGISLRALSTEMGTSHQLLMQQEKAEANDTISLKSLRTIADSLDCDLVYALVPRAGSVAAITEEHARTEARKQVQSVEHSMALEGQAVGHIDAAIEAETQRKLLEHKAK